MITTLYALQNLPNAYSSLLYRASRLVSPSSRKISVTWREGIQVVLGDTSCMTIWTSYYTVLISIGMFINNDALVEVSHAFMMSNKYRYHKEVPLSAINVFSVT